MDCRLRGRDAERPRGAATAAAATGLDASAALQEIRVCPQCAPSSVEAKTRPAAGARPHRASSAAAGGAPCVCIFFPVLEEQQFSAASASAAAAAAQRSMLPACGTGAQPRQACGNAAAGPRPHPRPARQVCGSMGGGRGRGMGMNGADGRSGLLLDPRGGRGGMMGDRQPQQLVLPGRERQGGGGVGGKLFIPDKVRCCGGWGPLLPAPFGLRAVRWRSCLHSAQACVARGAPGAAGHDMCCCACRARPARPAA